MQECKTVVDGTDVILCEDSKVAAHSIDQEYG